MSSSAELLSVAQRVGDALPEGGECPNAPQIAVDQAAGEHRADACNNHLGAEELDGAA